MYTRSIPFPLGVFRHSSLSLGVHLGSVNTQLPSNLHALHPVHLSRLVPRQSETGGRGERQLCHAGFIYFPRQQLRGAIRAAINIDTSRNGIQCGGERPSCLRQIPRREIVDWIIRRNIRRYTLRMLDVRMSIPLSV